MSFIKAIIEKLRKNQQNINRTLTEHKQTINELITEKQQNISETLTLETANKTCDFPLRVYLIVGKQGRGKTTLTKHLKLYFEQQGFNTIEVKSLTDLEQQNSVLIIDDLKRDLTKAIMNKLVENFRTVRHKKQIVILTHHLLRDIPSELIQLSEKVIMFQSLLNPNNINDKLNYLISKTKKEALCDLLRSLKLYQYIIIEHGKAYGVFENTDIKPIISENSKHEIELEAKSTTNSNNKNELLAIVKAKIPEFHYLTLTAQIVKLAELFPELKPKKIAEIVNTTPNTVRVILCRVRNS